MEMEILHAIQGMHTDLLDSVMILLSTLGNGGVVWIAVGIVLLLPKRTRYCGITMLAAMAVSFLLGNLCLKNIIQRARPCAVDTSVQLLIPFPSEYSFPSGHTLNSFTAATVIFLYFKKPGIFALLLAAGIAFSRMYLFVHYPTDILGGMVLGIVDAVMVYLLVKKIRRMREEKE